jgi:hypothetical protein
MLGDGAASVSLVLLILHVDRLFVLHDAPSGTRVEPHRLDAVIDPANGIFVLDRAGRLFFACLV